MSNPFTSPSAPAGGSGPAPRARDLAGCLVAYTPRILTLAGEKGNETGYGKEGPRDRVTADLLVLETPNGPIAFGGHPEVERDPVPHYLTVVGPARFEGVWVSQSNMVRFALAPGGRPAFDQYVGRLILGRIVRSEFGNNPWNLEKIDGPNGEMTPDLAKAIDIYNRLSMGALGYNTPQPIPGAPVPVKANATPAGPMPPANSVNYGYAPSPVPPTPTAWTTPPVPVAPAPVMPPMPAQPTPPVPNPAAAAVPAFDFAAFQAQQALAAQFQAVPIPPVAPGLPPQLTAQGWTLETWTQLNPDQQGQVLAATPG